MFSPLVSELIAEFIGTFLITLPVPLATAFVGPLSSLAIGFMTASMVYSFLFISGGHFNPAISFAMFISQRMTLKRFLLYIAVHFVSAWLSCTYAAWPIGVTISAPETADSLLAAWQTLTVEVVFSYVFVTAYMHTCVSRQRANQYYGFAIGFSFIAAVLCVPGGYTGSAFNPAVASALLLTKCFQSTGYCIHLTMVWLHWVAPFVGALIAVFLYGILDTEDRPGEGGAAANGTHSNIGAADGGAPQFVSHDEFNGGAAAANAITTSTTNNGTANFY